MGPEEKWMDRVYAAAEGQFDRDPDLHHQTISARMTSAALCELAEILAEHHTPQAAAFVRRITI